MGSPIRILHVVTKMDRAGLETMLMNYYRNIDRDKIQFDFLIHRSEHGAYDDEIEALGGKIYRTFPIHPKYLLQYQKYLKQFFLEHPEYRIVHSHLDSLSYYPLSAAKKAGVPVRIAHSHTSSFDRDGKLPFRIASKKLIAFAATDFWGCSIQAVRFMFGEKIVEDGRFSILPNAIDAAQFSFDPSVRIKIRRDLGIGDSTFVAGHVGRFSYPKNHEFLIDIFSQLHQIEPNSKLLLVGEGEKQGEIRKKVKGLGLEQVVSFLGSRSDVPELMQAMDVYVMPSWFEGLGNVLIEAQAAGLPCFASKGVIPEEAKITDLVKFISLDRPAQEWASQILACKGIGHADSLEQVQKAGYDVKRQAVWLQNEYEGLVGSR